MRRGSANDIYVIPAPDKLTFGTATLLSAACCVYAVLWLASMLEKILELNWKLRFGDPIESDHADDIIDGTNHATVGKMKNVNEMLRTFMSVAIIPVFVGAGMAILIVGEINFFSHQVAFQNEPLASIGTPNNPLSE